MKSWNFNLFLCACERWWI